MAKVDIGPAKRYGNRYGRRNREKAGLIEKEQRKKHKCPYCHSLKVKRKSAGIWYCKKCGAKFTGKAYTPGGKEKIKAPIEEKSKEE